ncbi:MAG: NAD(+)/NADH kinase [Clostridiales bacterium]|nr:NAD(+)/NADH kinase [Clostridiales bacterium]
MNKIGIIPNLSKDLGGDQTRLVIKKIRDKGLEALVMPDIYEIVGSGSMVESNDFFKESDILIVLGGDGTLLNAARQSCSFGIPILGINIGRLGFLTEIEISDIDKALDSLVANEYYVEKRMMLKASILKENNEHIELTALNEIAIAKASFARIIHLKVFINDEFVNYYPADGILVSSPTGSTAYSLSAGGPIISPRMKCLLLTPICPHALNARPIVTHQNDLIRIIIDDKTRDVFLTIDGQKGVPVKKGDIIHIGKADVETQLVRINKHNFFDVLREKLTERPLDTDGLEGGGS